MKIKSGVEVKTTREGTVIMLVKHGYIGPYVKQFGQPNELSYDAEGRVTGAGWLIRQPDRPLLTEEGLARLRKVLDKHKTSEVKPVTMQAGA